jgi:hypothetical protein
MHRLVNEFCVDNSDEAAGSRQTNARTNTGRVQPINRSINRPKPRAA